MTTIVQCFLRTFGELTSQTGPHVSTSLDVDDSDVPHIPLIQSFTQTSEGSLNVPGLTHSNLFQARGLCAYQSKLASFGMILKS